MNPEDLQVHLKAFLSLIQARLLARVRSIDTWQFAIDSNFLFMLGAKQTDLRIWKASGIIQVADETTPSEAPRRTFRGINQAICKAKRPVSVLTDSGLQLLLSAKIGCCTCNDPTIIRPHWVAKFGELRFAGQLIKRFRWNAPNQLRVLQAFQDKGWPERITNVFPISGRVDCKRQLHDTIKCLNRRQKRELIRFHGDGTGLGTLWRLYDPSVQKKCTTKVAGIHRCSLTLGRE